MPDLKNLHPGWWAAGIATLVFLWMLSGIGGGDTDDDTAGKALPNIKVMVMDSTAQDLTREAVISARTEPLRGVELRAELSARVVETLVEPGTAVEAGTLLLRLDPRDRPQQLEKAGALVQQRMLEYEAAKRMARKNLRSEVELATAQANKLAAQAELARLRSEIEQTEIRAPFAGVVETRPLEAGDFANVGDVLATVLDHSAFLVTGHVSEDDIGFLKAGQPGRARLTDGREVSGTLRYVAGQADERSRTFRVELLVANNDGRLILGSSAVLWLPLEQVRAHVIEPGSLALNEDGSVGVKSVDEANRVHFHHATIAQNRGGKVWLSGLPDRLRVITVGQGFAADGDTVDPVQRQP